MKVWKPIKNLTREDVNSICNHSDGCSCCILRAVCCLTADPYKLFQEYKNKKIEDYCLERVVFVWVDTEEKMK